MLLNNSTLHTSPRNGNTTFYTHLEGEDDEFVVEKSVLSNKVLVNFMFYQLLIASLSMIKSNLTKKKNPPRNVGTCYKRRTCRCISNVYLKALKY